MKHQKSAILRHVAALARDEQGAVLSTELILVSIVAVIGMITGLASMRDSMVSELSDIAGSVQSINQSYSYTGSRYTRLDDGSIEILLDIPPEHESEEGEPAEPPVEHVIGGVGSLDFSGGVSTGVGGSASGVIGDGAIETTFTTTTDTGQILGSFGNQVAFRESPDADGVFTTTFDAPITDLELFVGNLAGVANDNLLGNFTVTLSDGTVINNAAFSVIPDTVVGGATYGEFTSQNSDRDLLEQVNIGGINYVRDPTVNGAGSQGVGRIVFTDIPAPGPHCVGISSVSFERSGGPSNFRAFYSFSGSVVEIQP